ncbi:SH3 domain-containing protein [Roseobacteraceae bacterium S113]
MTRFIVLTFAFLGWSFYELSGGADYEPQSARAPIFAEVEPVVARAVVEPVLSTRQEPSDLVQVSLNVEAPAPVAEPTVVPVVEEAKAEILIRPTPVGLTAAPTPTPAENVSVVFTPTPQAAPQEAAAAEVDLRQVTGNRVNMRNGPGTSFSVLARLEKGTDVEVLGFEDDGWLKLRVIESGQVGYMADWLVTASAE